MFRLTREPLSSLDLADPRAGGYVTFEGRVRNENEGRAVVALEYEAFEAMAQTEGEGILRDAFEKFPIVDARCAHRIGHLKVGDVALSVAVASGHRSEAFAACRYIVDEIKHRLPIWKKELYEDGDSGWVNCDCHLVPDAPEHPSVGPGVDLAAYYSRQTILAEVGEQGQSKLAQTRVLVVGAGGLGCPALMYLAGAGVGTIGISDGDDLDIANLHRQVLYSASDVGKPKAELAKRAVLSLNPQIEVRTHGRVTPHSGDSIFARYDLILDCTDNFASKFLLSDAAVRLQKPLVQASIYQFEGQIHTYVPGKSACLRCLWPKTPDAGCVGTCAEVGVMGFTAGFFGVLQATEAVKLALGIGESLVGETLIVNLLNYDVMRLSRVRDPQCPTCGVGMPVVADVVEWRIEPIAALRSDLPIVDVREPSEAPQPVPGLESRWRHLPMSELGNKLSELDALGDAIVLCAHGVRSDRIVRQLRESGRLRLRSLQGGYEALARACRS